MSWPSAGWPRTLWLGAFYGVLAWSAYAVVEEACFVAPAIVQGGRAPDLWPSLAAFIALSGIGAAAGATTAAVLKLFASVSGSLRRTAPEMVLSAAGVLTLLAGFTWNLHRSVIVWPYLWPQLLVILALGVAVIAGVFSPARRLVRLVATPWGVSFMLLGLSAVIYRHPADAPSTGSLLWTALIGAALFALGAVAGRTRLGDRVDASRGHLWRAFAVRLAALSAVLTAGTFATVRDEAAARPPDVSVQGSQQARPNVILIVMDTVGAGHVSLYGYSRPTSPRLESLAREATMYENAIAPGNMTLTSHSSLFTGMYPSQHGAVPPYGMLAPSHDTLAEILERHGYATAGVIANHGYLDATLGLAQGFRYWSQRAAALPAGARQEYYLRRWIISMGRKVVPPRTRFPPGPQITGQALARLNALSAAGAPFFLFLNYMDAHEPYEPGPPFNRKFGEPVVNDPNGGGAEQWKGDPLRHTEEGRRQLATMYDGAVAAVDFEVGRIIDRLKELGQYDRSLIIVTSDHGEAFGEGGHTGHGGLYLGQAVLHVPLVIKYPGDARPQRVKSYVSLVDLMPTVLDVLGLPGSAAGSGVSLVAPGKPHDEVLSEAIPEELGRHDSTRVIISDGYKLVLSTVEPPALYDLANDPGERTNLYGESDPRATKLASRLTALLGGEGPVRGDQQAPDAETLERLRALGYVR